MDALRLIRDHVVNGHISASTHDANEIHLREADVPLRRSAETNYRSKVGNKLLKVEQIWYFIKHHVQNPSMAHTAYMKAAIADGFATLSMLDRNDLIDYLTGKKATSERIDVTAVLVDDEAGIDAGKRAREDEDEDGVPRERVLRDRNSVLRAPKDMTSVLAFFKAPEEEMERLQEEKQQAEDLAKGVKNQRYRDVKEQVFWREHVGSDFDFMNLDTNASFLSGPNPGVANGIDVPSERRTAPAAQPSAPSGPSSVSARKPSAMPAKAPVKKKTSGIPGGIPIIIVPAGFNQKVVLNMFNAKEFLQNGKFTPWDVVQKSGAKKSSSVYISRTYKRDGSKIKYEVTEKAPHKRSEDWARVAACFVLGAKWQFKDWPFRGVEDGDLVETFSKIRGFHARFDGDPEIDVVKTWNVKTITVSRTQRHGDRAAFEFFWDELDKHLALRSSALKY
ncbi:RNA polymerase II accessory factor, Cdc73 [Ostreococcus tauri]|uniref:RNA polymerase II accessory factor, Cdc73 n=1 Tax=Ostreococcus tauri TaxID=70448 RepID=A0A090M5U5_OSTTA|nr:RNA polymerase II accessory factor, Cdc73 [Ostreococcus tauri]CEF99556.1 RNA polymerase II accessory factor, Cdc73 [Ostreococcus tauri]|eukprot:XP_022839900.1 RNA polymerase II accessory factor, Cdc73 [Ostreococcus tauri]